MPRTAISDDGPMISLAVYGDDGAVVVVPLAPVRAVAIAGELIKAAMPKLSPAEETSVTSAPKRGRGGDPYVKQRRELHGGLRALAEFRKRPGKPLVTIATEIIERQKRFQPMPKETDPERQEMLRVRNTGLRVPGVRRVVSIISE